MEDKIAIAMAETTIKLKQEIAELIKRNYIAYTVEVGGILSVQFPWFFVTVDVKAQSDQRKR